MSWAIIIKVVAPIALDMMFNGDKGDDGAQKGLVRPKPPEVPGQREVEPFDPDDYPKRWGSKEGSIIGAEPALKAVNPSTMEAKYWSAIFSDAKSKSRISLTGIREKRD